jgi:endonuclease/exonuclease/phosphatase family metal-dependent hydrolase
MNRIIVLQCLVICFLCKKTYAMDEKQYIIASYNIENFWDSDPYNTPDTWNNFLSELNPDRLHLYPQNIQYNDYSLKKSNWYNPYIIKRKIDNFLTVLQLSGYPDIVALQEIESANNTSNIFNSHYSNSLTFKDALNQLGYTYLLIGKQDYKNPVAVTTAFISKIELTEIESIEITIPGHRSSSRNIQLAEFYAGSDRIVLFNNHWKSKSTSNSELIRNSIALQVRERINKEKEKNPLTHIIILGDLNTHYYEEPLKKLQTTGDETKMLLDSTPLLYNLWYEKKQKDRWEYSYDGARQSLSHVIISDSLYSNEGFYYIDQSFEVIGHNLPAKNILLNSEGIPFRWQKTKTYSTSYHIGKGYSDHLPLVTKFYYKTRKKSSITKQTLISPTQENIHNKPKDTFLNKVELCNENKAIDLLDYQLEHWEQLYKKCIKLFIPLDQRPLELFTRGRYKQNYIIIPNHQNKQNMSINIAMTRKFDWRPNIDDTRVNKNEIYKIEKYYNSFFPHPRSNKCYNRKILQKKGGYLRKIVGIIDYSNGQISILTPNRQKTHLILENLPYHKKKECLWNSL